jgi:biopolymer transport protein ExbD
MVLGFLIAPMVDILLVVLVFFIVTWNFALSENELDVRVPTASKANETQPYVGQVVINISANGTVIVNRQPKSSKELLDLLKRLAQLYPDQAVIVRGDQAVDYKHVVDVLDICRQADIWNVAFATGKPDQ